MQQKAKPAELQLFISRLQPKRCVLRVPELSFIEQAASRLLLPG